MLIIKEFLEGCNCSLLGRTSVIVSREVGGLLNMHFKTQDVVNGKRLAVKVVRKFVCPY